MSSCAAIMLAAGEGRRMGRSKQLLPFGPSGTGTMLSHCIAQARAARFERLIVVVGARAEEVQASLADIDIEFVLNNEWQSGMGSSIVAGMRHLQCDGLQPDAVAILLGDQPLVRTDQLREMRVMLEISGAYIVAARYRGTLGVPAIFKSRVFRNLSKLSPEEGARKLLRDSALQVVPFDLPEAAMDVDTPEDFEKLNLLTGS